MLLVFIRRTYCFFAYWQPWGLLFTVEHPFSCREVPSSLLLQSVFSQIPILSLSVIVTGGLYLKIVNKLGYFLKSKQIISIFFVVMSWFPDFRVQAIELMMNSVMRLGFISVSLGHRMNLTSRSSCFKGFFCSYLGLNWISLTLFQMLSLMHVCMN